MDLSEKTNEICEELSKGGKAIEPTVITATDFFPKAKYDTYLGFKPKKRFQLFRQPPIFKLEEKAKNMIILTSLSREYDNKIREIANKNNFGYNIEEPHGFTAYL